MQGRTAVILCGGRGKRLGPIGDELPKALVPVHGKPILWYIFVKLYLEGYRHFILPLGYRGHLIQNFIDRSLTDLDARIDAIPTGENTEVGQRLALVRHLLPKGSFLLINGDTLFDFDVARVADEHDASGMDVTLTSCRIISQFGLVVLDGDRVTEFTRDSLVRSYQVVNRPDGGVREAFVNSGIALVRSAALDAIDLAHSPNFEAELYPALIARGTVRHYAIEGYWFAVDTPKDMEIANAGNGGDPRSAGALALHAKLAEAYRTLPPPA